MRQEPRFRRKADAGAGSARAEPEDLQEEIAALRRELHRLNGHRFVRVQNSLSRLLWWQLLRGLALGLGTVIGASVLVSILAFFLAKVDFIPIIGDWAADFAEQMESEMRARQDGSIGPDTEGAGTAPE